MAKRKNKANPRRKANIKKEDEKKKNIAKTKSIRGLSKTVDMEPKSSNEDMLGSLFYRRTTRNSGFFEQRNGILFKENEQSGQTSTVSLDKQIGEQTNDLGEFAKTIVRLQREAQLELNYKYDPYDGEQGGFSNENEEDDMSPDYDPREDVEGDADAILDAEVDAEVDANVDAEADANAYIEANETEIFMEPDQHLTEAYLEEDLEAQPEFQSGKSKRKVRGPTMLPHLEETNCRMRKVVEYNENGQPIGRVAVELASYMGVLARRMVPITHKNWRKMPKTLIEELWSCLESRFVLDPRSRRILISGIGDKWRCFKSNLTRLYVLPLKDQADLLAHPPRKYGFIKQEHWDAFVRSRLSDEFQALHKAQSERRGQYLYPHRLSRRGYARLAEDLKKSGEYTPVEIDRSILWKKARQDKKGDYINDATREKAEMIDDLKSQLKGKTSIDDLKSQLLKEGTPVDDVKADVLTLALGTPERNGRVRGVGKFITPTSYFHTPRCRVSKYIEKLDEQCKSIEGKWQEERESRIKVEDRLRSTQDRVARLEDQLAQLINQGNQPPPIAEKVCSNTTESPKNDYGKSVDDEMFPSDPKSRHAKELDIMSTFQTFYTRASQILMSKLSSVSIVVDDAVFGTDMELFLDLDDIRYLCLMEDLSANCIMVYIRHLHDILVSKGMQDMYTFVNPAFVSSESGENMSDAITERLQTTDCQWIFVPFNTERHWILVVINMRTMRCYWLDPLGLPDQYNIKPLINLGLKALQVDGKRRSNPIWCTIKCPKQSGNVESGIYVMRYMRELIDEIPNPLTTKKPFTKLTYNQDEIDAVRLEWVHFVAKYV